jgi:thiol-disulfide isomerase/thioredoxin
MSARWVFIASIVLAFAAPAVADDYPHVKLPAVGCGGELSLDEARGRVATVLVCLSIECPISNEYVPTINALVEEYRDSGVNFVGINPSGGQTLDQMAEYAKKVKLAYPFVKDDGGKVSRRLSYSVTPEARVFDAKGELVYSGRIDDRYRRGGATDKNVARDLAKALDEVIAGKEVSAARTKAIGCPIQIADPRASKD